MPGDKYSAVWVSHSSISDFLSCPRAYYLKNVYKDPSTGNKIQIISPPLTLGQVVHEVIESLSVLPTDKRFDTPLIDTFEKAWEKVSGERGGFTDRDVEERYKRRGEDMLRRVTKNPGPLLNLAVKIKADLPQYWLSEEDNIMLCGKIDWLEFLEEEEAVHIIDFKTGTSKQDSDSLQLPIYHLLAHNTQKYPVAKASYWYIEQNDEPTPQKLPDLEKSEKEVMKIAKKIKLARQLESFLCPHGGCRYCTPYERILDGEGKKVGTGGHGHDIYLLEWKEADLEEESMIL
jgi:ATP-dependent helicase/DNAse subunit B